MEIGSEIYKLSQQHDFAPSYASPFVTLRLLWTPLSILPSKYQNSMWSGALTLSRHGSNSQLLSLHQNEPEITGLFYSATVRLHT